MMNDKEAASLGEMVARLFWMMVGPLALAGLAYAILTSREGWLTAADFAFLGVLAGMMLARWLEFRGVIPGQPTGNQPRQLICDAI